MPEFPPPRATQGRWLPAKQSDVEGIIEPPKKNRLLAAAFLGIVALAASLGFLLSRHRPAPRATPNVIALVDNASKQSVPAAPAEAPEEEIKIINPREAEPELKPNQDSRSNDDEWSQNPLEWNAIQTEQLERAEKAPPSQTAPRPPQLVLGANPSTPEPAPSEICLGPAKLREIVYLFANNPGEAVCIVAIEIKAGPRKWERSLTAVLAPHSTQRLNLRPWADDPAMELRESDAPLECRMLDIQHNDEVLDELVIPAAFDPGRGEMQPALRIQGQRFVRPNPRLSLPLEVIDPPAGATLEVTVGHRVEGEFTSDLPAKIYPSAKKQRIIVSPQRPDGGLMFEAKLEDWVMPLDTRGLPGEHEVVARLINAGGVVVAKAVYLLVVDDSAPTNTRILNSPKAGRRGSTIVLRATAVASPSGIKEAQFFLGRPVDAKVPANVAVFKATLVDAAKQVWEAAVLLPPDGKGPTEVTAMFTNQVGLSSFATAAIEVKDADPAKTELGRVKGTVLLGELRQPGLLVTLRDGRGNAKASTTTGPDGSFRFDNVPPGSYTVYCRKTAAQRHGSAPAVVLPNGDTIVTVVLILRATK